MFSAATWETPQLGFVACPGISHHTTQNGRKDCRITINDGRPPTIHCCHNSCAHAVADANFAMRSAIGKLKTSATTGNHERAGRVVVTRLKPQAPKEPDLQPRAKLPLNPVRLPDPLEDGQRRHLEACFEPAELCGFVFGAPDSGRPVNKGFKGPPAPLEVVPEHGTFVRVNPMREGEGVGDADVLRWRHCLIEGDTATPELQWAAILASGLPVSAVVHSGGKSIHAWVRVDASTAEEFRERARAAADAIDAYEGIQVDRAVLNPSRLSRLAGCPRDSSRQELLALKVGAECWDDWVAVKKANEPAPRDSDSGERIDFYYRKHSKDFLMAAGAKVVPLNRTDLKLAATQTGQVESDDKAELDRFVWRIMTEAEIDYDGPLPGYRRGLHLNSGRRYLVTEEAAPVVAAQGDTAPGWERCETIHSLLLGLLTPPNKPDDMLALYALLRSLKLSREALRIALESDGARTIRPGPATVFCGPRNCGKSLLVNHIIAPLLGGRVADAHKAFTTGAEGFNGELLGAEVWLVDDKIHSCDIKSRRQFGASIKSLLYSGRVGFHAKFKEQITVEPWARLFVLCNDQEESIRVLPVLSDDLADKMHLFRCYQPQSALPTLSGGDWAVYGAKLRAELPVFAAIVDAIEIPERFADSRNGMRCHQDPYIVRLLAEQTPEHQLALLLLHIAEFRTLPATARTAHEWLDLLMTIEGSDRQVRELVHDDPMLLGRYLGRLASNSKAHGVGLTVTRRGAARNGALWEISTPAQLNATK